MSDLKSSKKEHSKGHIFEIAWSFATEWVRAVNMFEYRLRANLPEDQTFFEHKFFRDDVDFHCFLMSLNRLKRAIMLAHRSIDDTESKRQLGEAIQEFDKALPSLGMFRNVGEHFDDYILQRGHNGLVDSRGLRVYTVSIDDEENYVVEWLDQKIDVHQATNKANKLYKAFTSWYNSNAKVGRPSTEQP